MSSKLLFKELAGKQILRFALSAGAGFILDISLFYLLYHNLLRRPSYAIFAATVRNSTLSLAISFFCGVILNFLINRYLVFQESPSKLSKQFIRFVSVAIIGFFANLAVVKILIQSAGMYPPVARPVAALSLFFASFFIHKMFSFSLSLRHHAS